MQILRSTLRAMRHLSGTKDVRYYLNGVLVEVRKGQGVLVATDGSVLGAHAFPVDADEPDAEFIIPLDAIKALKARGSTSVEILRDGMTLTIRTPDGDTQATAIDGKFPDWRRVMPDRPSGEHAHFDPDHLARFCDVARDLFGAHTKQKPLVWANGTAAGLVNFDGFGEFRGAVSGSFYRKGEAPTAPAMPAWLTR